MQDNEITLAVDVLHNSTFVDKVYTRMDQYMNRTVYVSEDHSFATPDTLTFYRTFPKPSGNYPGQAKAAVKFSKTVSVPGVDGADVFGPFIIEVSASLPVGVTPAVQLEIRQRATALLNREDIMVDLFNQLEI